MIREVQFNSATPLQGFIFQNYIPECSESSTLYPTTTYNPVVNLKINSGNPWASDNIANSYFIYDFDLKLNSKIEVHYYSIKTHNGTHFPTKWEIQGSNDKENWFILHTSKNGDEFTQKFQTKSFNVDTMKPFRYIRYYDIGPNEKGDNYVCLFAFEVFGKLYLAYNTGNRYCSKVGHEFMIMSLVFFCVNF